MEQPSLGSASHWSQAALAADLTLQLLTLSVIEDVPQFHQHGEFLLREQDRRILTELLLPRHVLCTRTSYFYHPFTTLSPPSSPFPTWLQTNLEISSSEPAPNF